MNNHRPGPLLRGVRPALAAVVTVVTLAACSGGGTATAGASSTAAAPSATPGRGGFDPARLTRVRQCLDAAGISLPTPTGTFTRRPQASPSGTPRRGPGATGGRGGAFGAVLRSPAAQAALRACGITLPTRPPGPPTGPATTG